jgi:CubicO group peptidase (beta-lactamase class C family)
MKAVISVILFSVLNISCGNHHPCDNSYNPPEFIDDGLDVGTLNEVNIDQQMILKAAASIQQGKYKEVHALLIYKDKKLVFEEYFKGHIYQWDGPGYHGEHVQWDRDMLHHTMSCTKSFTSACIGIAIEQGFIDDVHQSIFNYLPGHQHLNSDGKDRITIEHLLTMTSGLQWNEWGAPHGTSANDIDRIYLDCEDPVTCVLERSLQNEPGQKFTYNGGGMIILGEILNNAANMNIDRFSMEYLFRPLGVDSTIWYQFENGTIAAEGSLYLTPRNMIKFGAVYLHGGAWHGKQIVPEDWVEKSKVPYNNNTGIRIPIDDSGRNGYAYSWWTNELSLRGRKTKIFSASGWGGQAITVIPDKNMVVVFTGGNYAGRKKLHEILERFILPSVD